MSIVTLEALKKQMNIDFDDDDEIVTLYGEAAERSVVNMTRRSVSELKEENMLRTGSDEFPTELTVAILMLAAHLYRMREPVAGLSLTVVPFGLQHLVKPWTRLEARVND